MAGYGYFSQYLLSPRSFARLSGGPTEWYTACLTAFVFSIVLLVAGRLWVSERTLKHTLHQLHTAGVQSTTAIFTEESVSFLQDNGNSIYKWPVVKAIWKSKGAWMFFVYTYDIYVVVPADSIGPGLHAFIEQCARQHGIRIW
jgi:hypothetical protein